jgi:hypothetical protein
MRLIFRHYLPEFSFKRARAYRKSRRADVLPGCCTDCLFLAGTVQMENARRLLSERVKSFDSDAHIYVEGQI